MTLTKNKMVREIGRRTRLKIELENFLVLEIKEIDRGINGGTLRGNGRSYSAPRFIYKLVVRPSKKLKSNFISNRNET